MDSKQNTPEEGLARAVEGGSVSRRWLLKSTGTLAVGTLAATALGTTRAEAKPAAVPEKASPEHDPHTNHQPAFNAAAFDGWESV